MVLQKRSKLTWLFLALFFLLSCNMPRVAVRWLETPTPSLTPTITLTPTPSPSPTPTLTPTPTPIVQMSLNEWEARFLNAWVKESQNFEKWSRSDDCIDYYELAYGIDGITAMYEATGNPMYLDQVLYYVKNVVANARPSYTIPNSQYQDDYLGWGEYTDAAGLFRRESPLIESYLWRYVTRLLRVIRQTPQIYEDAYYRGEYEALLSFTEKHIFEKWYRRDPKYLFPAQTHKAAHWASIALDLWLITDDEERRELYRDVYSKINVDLSPVQVSSLRDQLIPHPQDETAYFWDDDWGIYDLPGQKTSYANNDLAYIVEAHDQGVYWTDADIDGFENLLLKVLWNGSYSEPSFSEYLDGSQPGKGVFQSDGFIKLGRYNPYIQKIYENYHGQRNVLCQYYGNAALNRKRLDSLPVP